MIRLGIIRSAAVPTLPRALSGRRRLVFAGLLGIGLCAASAAIMWSLLVGAAVDWLAQAAGPAGVSEPVTPVVVGLVGLAVLTASLVGAERVLAERLGQSWVNDLRVTVFERVARTPVREHRRSTGSTAMRFVGDMTAMRRWAALGLAKLAVGVPMVAGCLVALALANPLIAVAVGAVVVLGFGAIRLVTPRLYATNRVARRRRAQVAAHVTEHVAHRLVMQAFGREGAERSTLRRRGRTLGRAMVRRAEMIGAVRAIGEATTLLAGAAALIAAIVARAEPAAAAAALAVIGILTSPLRDLARVAEFRAAAVVALEKLEQMMQRPVRRKPTAAVALPPGPGRLELEGVTLGEVLKGITADVPAGSVVAVAGANGSGKTTLLTVLAGLVPPDAGRVLLDGIDLVDLDERALRRAIGLASPDLPLLRGAIIDNIRYADPDADEQQLARAIRTSGLDEVIRDLPDGLATRVGEGGAGLSAGQRQRVALARAVLPQPRVLLLDEADAHLDPAAGSAVDRLVGEFVGTVVVVTHRFDQLPGPRTVWRLAEGRVRIGSATDPAAPRDTSTQ
ncbi:MAG: ATP-binding cassette domain-containing protein [Pseudonocardiales bacterium]